MVNTKWILAVLTALFILIAGSIAFSADFAPDSPPFTINLPSSNLPDSTNWIIANATVEAANAAKTGTTATQVAAGAAVVYALITILLILGQRKSRLDDKFPCLVVRSRLVDVVRDDGSTGQDWTLRLVNVGRGPAFIEYCYGEGLHDCSCDDGDLTNRLDRVVGPDAGDPLLQVAFAQGDPRVLRRPELKIIIHYHDIAGRLFKSRLVAGKPEYERPPWYGSWLERAFMFLHLKN